MDGNFMEFLWNIHSLFSIAGKPLSVGDVRMAECIRKEYNKQTENAVLFKGWNQ